MATCCCIGPVGDCPCARAARFNAPFDAPIRMRELQREEESRRYREWIESDEGKEIFGKMVREAMEKVRAGKETREEL
jgi:hypothetical protein